MNSDGSQMFISTRVNDAAQRSTACVRAISDWMSASRLKLNENGLYFVPEFTENEA